ncbi:MAG TPA: tetratricopeptide repeat protein [Fimbriimonas sp.]|nr:tetratricopeptide repeat protein [Fimbriimonas sp.]
MAFDVRTIWDFSDPAKSEKLFREELKNPHSQEEQLEIWAQIARCYGLQGQFEQAHEILDDHWPEAERLQGRPLASFLLERGRVFRSSKAVERAYEFFDRAADSDELDLKLDAMHMQAIVAEPDDAIKINTEALEIARSTTDNEWARRWAGTLANNLGWSYFDQGKYEEALKCFEEGLEERNGRGTASQIHQAKWAVGRCLRALGRFEEALEVQEGLDKSDGYVVEELAELHLAMAKQNFAQASELLGDVYGKDSDAIKRMDLLAQT